MRCAAKPVVPNPATTIDKPTNAKVVRICSMAAGTPMTMTCLNTLQRGSQSLCSAAALARIDTPFLPRNSTPINKTSATAREAKVAQALPTAPNCGSPATPLIRPYAKIMLMTLAIAVTINGVRVSPMPRNTPLPISNPTSTMMVPMVTCR